MRDLAAEVEEAEERSRAEAERDLPFNFGALLTHGLLGQTGFRLVQAPTFLPQFVSELAGSASAVGIMRAVQSFGMFLSPVVSASIVEHRERAKGLALLFGGSMRVMILMLAAIALFAPAEVALPAVWCVLGVFGLALGMQGVAFQYVMSKTIPPERRGRLLGLRNAAASVTLLGVVWVGGWLVQSYGFPEGYGYTFLLGGILASAGLGVFAIVREPPSHERRERERLGVRVRQIPALLRAEDDFRRFLVARLIATAARGALPLYTPFLAMKFGMTGLRLAGLTMFFAVAQGASGLVWGPLADRRGFKAVFTASLACWAAATLLLVVTPGLELAYPIFALIGAGLGGFMLAGTSLVLEFGDFGDRAMRIATSNSFSELTGVAGFLAAGFAADAIGFETVFVASAALQGLALLFMRRVREPRVRIEPPLDVE
jgi:MFS family permease